MKAAHTPGPWVVASDSDMDNDDCYGIFSEDGLDAASFENDFIALTNLDHKNFEANARLISAAPELLESLIYLRDCAESGELPSIERWWRVQAVIKKAQGDS